ncbi:GPP34 family phosphoprotein [Streptomyces sp. NPDC049040]|uniref:GOLPH3/VPS74 family protein n=1 Tax=Streptomyces sp. NPDC049040 TaxID=3365593 RepID=UPI0037133909
MGDDLLLLAMVPGRRRIRVRSEERLRFALRAAELAELSLAGRITVGPRRIEVLDSRRVETPRLTNVLHGLASADSPPGLQSWLRRTPRSLTTEYLSRLEDQKTVRVRRQRDRGGRTRYHILSVDLPRRRAVVSRLDAAIQADPRTAAHERDLVLARLAHAAGIAGAVHPGLSGYAGRRRMAALAEMDGTAAAVAAAVPAADGELTDALTAGVRTLTDRLDHELREVYSDLTTGGHGLGHDLHAGNWSDGGGGGHHGGGHHGGGHHGGGDGDGGHGGW